MKAPALCLIVLMLLCLTGCSLPAAAERDYVDVPEQMKESIVYLDISSYPYDRLRPWRNADVKRKSGIGCAVGGYEVITPAWNLTDARLIKVRRFGQNEYIPATIKVIDYENDLALLQLDANSMTEPLRPVKFTEQFEPGAKLNYYRLSENGQLNTGHGYLDRARVRRSTVSFASFLNYIVTNTSGETSTGQVYCDGSKPVAIACWSKGTKEAGLIPAVVINKFLADAADGEYRGAPLVGFAAANLRDPAMRAYLKMPASVKNGVRVSKVRGLGTGADLLRADDVILAIDGHELDSYGRFLDPLHDRIFFHHLITNHEVGDIISFDIWRDGSQQQIEVKAENFDAQQMLIPYYEYGLQPEYVITGGFVFQKLTRSYLTSWGSDWQGKVAPHLYHYYRDMAFEPSPERSDIVILSYVLPAEINLGYKDLRRIVVRKVNGMQIGSVSDILIAQKLNHDARYDVFEFELDNPRVVIARDQLPAADVLISRSYGIRKLVNINR